MAGISSVKDGEPAQLANDFQELGMQKKELEFFPSKRKKKKKADR